MGSGAEEGQRVLVADGLGHEMAPRSEGGSGGVLEMWKNNIKVTEVRAIKSDESLKHSKLKDMKAFDRSHLRWPSRNRDMPPAAATHHFCLTKRTEEMGSFFCKKDTRPNFTLFSGFLLCDANATVSAP